MKWLDFIQHNLRKFCISALAIAAVVLLLVDEHEHPPAIVIATILTVTLLYTYVKHTDVESLVPGVVALEVIFITSARHQVAAQVIVTLLIAIAVEAATAVKAAAAPRTWPRAFVDVFRVSGVAYYYAWLVMRAVFIVLAGTEASTRWWYLSQLFVVLCLLALLGDTKEAQFVTLALATVAGLLYSYKDTVPWGISIVLLAVPLLYIVNGIVPSPQPPEVDADADATGDKWQHAKGWLSAHAFVGTAMVCVAAAVVWQRKHALAMFVHVESCNAQNNLVKLTPQCKPGRQVGKSCCCAPAHTNFNDHGCVPYACADAVQNFLFDCCGNSITAENTARLFGAHMCVDGQSPATL